jgi:CheY-like chemotaxis protein
MASERRERVQGQDNFFNLGIALMLAYYIMDSTMNQTESPLILLVDDDASFLEVLSLKLSSEGFRIETAHDGKEGLARARVLKPDLVLLDMKMPGMDGSDVLQLMRVDPLIKDIKAIFLSGIVSSDEEQFKIDERFAMDAGALGCIRKTDDLSAIASQIEKYLGIIPTPPTPKMI